MSELIHRAQQARMALGNLSLPKWQRVTQGLEAFSGLTLTGIAVEVRERLEADLSGINQVLSQYSLEANEDYQGIGDSDLQKMLEIIETACTGAIEGELGRIVADLDAGTARLPREAIQETREHRDLMIPRLIEVLRETSASARRGPKPEGNVHFFAIFLLTELQAEEGFPAILEAFSLPGELPFDLFGDAVTSMLARILARFASDQVDLLDSLIADPDLNQYVRWEAAQSYVYLVRDGCLPRDEAVERLGRLLRLAMHHNDRAIISGLICVLTSFAPEEVLEEIKEAYRQGLVDSGLVSLEGVERRIAQGESGVLQSLERCPETGVADTIGELGNWASFAEQPAPRRTAPPPSPQPPVLAKTGGRLTGIGSSQGRRVGRNDPCPCGSGRKFKKCCGSRA